MSEETDTTAETTEAETETEELGKARTTPTGINPLSKKSDAAEKPGFRSPGNKGSKAIKRKKKKKR